MRKLEGLRFLQDWFPSQSVDCLYFGSARDLRDYDGREATVTTVWHARTGRRIGSELQTPIRRCGSINELHIFGDEVFGAYTDAELVVHRVTESFYAPVYVGSIAVYHRPVPVATIEFQAMLTWHGTEDGAARPRDWSPVARYGFPFLSRLPASAEGPAVEAIGRSYRAALAELWDIANHLADRTSRRQDGRPDDTVTRFNVYRSGRVLLDDHRSVKSFVRPEFSGVRI